MSVCFSVCSDRRLPQPGHNSFNLHCVLSSSDSGWKTDLRALVLSQGQCREGDSERDTSTREGHCNRPAGVSPKRILKHQYGVLFQN